MPAALEQLRQGIGGVQPISALEKLRHGIIEPIETADLFGTQTSTPAFMFPKSEYIKTADIAAGRELSPRAEQFKVEAETAEREAAKGKFLPALGETLKNIGQNIARNIGSAAVTIAKPFGGVEEVTPPESLQFLFSKEPIKSIEQRIADAELEVKKWGEERKDTILGKIAFNNPESLAFIGIMGSVGLDLTPFGGLEKNAFKALKGANTIGDALIVLKKMGVADDIARQFAEEVVKVTDDKAAKTLFARLAELQQTTKATPRIAPEIGKELQEITPKIEDTISKLIKSIDDSVPLRGEQKKLYEEELAKRTARVAAMGEKVGGEKGFFAQLGQLKGPLPKAQFEAIRKQFSQTEVDLLFDTIEKTKTLLPLEKVATKQGLTKLLEGVVITPSEIEHLREVFPKELIDAVLARRPWLEKAKDLGGELWNLSRTMMATLDLSAPFRQGVFMLGRPIRFAQAFKDMFKFAISEKAYQGLIEGIKTRPTYLKMRQGRLALTEIGGPLLKREERFMSQLAEKIPGYGALVRGSNRAYTGFLNKLRADIFDDILKKAEIMGRDIDEPLLKNMADFINAGTGRGKFGLFETGIIPKSMEKAAVVLNGIFFSPRLMASRLNLLNPYFYVQLDPLVRKEAIKTLFATSGILGGLYGLWKLNGGEVGLDPRNADFGKMKIGNTRYDPLGGFQQYIRLAAQLITGEIVSSTTGRTITLGEGFKPLTRREIALKFFENKESPIASFLTGWLQGTTPTGQDFDIPAEMVNRFIPMVVQDLYDISQEKGAEGILYGLPAVFGAGVQTYGKQELAFGESRIREPTAQIRPVPELAEKIRELVLGQLPLGSSKSFSVEAYFDQLSNLPREEAADIFDKIAETNPELAEKLHDVVKEREFGITVKDKDLKAKGVASGDRALAIKKELDKSDTKEEKAILWDDYVKKGVITEEVARQLNLIYR